MRTIIYNIVITILLIVSFFMCIGSFLIGLKWGKSIGKGSIPNIPNMTKVIHKKAKSNDEIVTEGMNNIFNYDMAKAIEYLDKQRVVKNG